MKESASVSKTACSGDTCHKCGPPLRMGTRYGVSKGPSSFYAPKSIKQ